MTTEPEDLRRLLARRRSAARRVLWFEQIGPAIWPALGVVGLWVAASLFDLPALLPPLWHLGALIVAVAAIGWVLWRGLHGLSAPTADAVDRRLESVSGLRHRPLVVLDDQPAAKDPESAAVWQAHLDRAAAQVARLRVGWPRPVLARLDQRALRGFLLVTIAAGLVVAGADAPDRLLRSITPTLPPGASAPEPLLQAWVTPPGYTGLAPIFLKPEMTAVQVPAGSHLTVSLTGSTGAPSLTLGGVVQPFQPLDATSWQADRDVGAGGQLAVRRRGRMQGSWTLVVLADLPPTVAWTNPPGPDPKATLRRLLTRLPWTAADDYGVVSLQAELRLRDRPSAPPVIVPLPLPGGAPRQAHGEPAQDLTANPWAGLPVIATLVAKDAPGQRGTSAEAGFTLPERSFKNPLARALIDIRKRLSLAPQQHGQASSDLAALADEPDAFDNNTGVFLVLSATATLLDRSGAPADVAEAQQRLWDLALKLEDDAVARTAQAVQAARDALQQSLQHGDKTDMDRKMEALQREIERHLQALVQKAQRDGTLLPFDPQARTLSTRDFDRLAQEMRDAAKAGRMDEARDKMAQMERMLDQLKAAEANPNDRRRAAQQRQRGQQQMGAAEDMIQREHGMQQNGRARANPAQRDTDARQQRALRRALGEMMQQFGDLTGKVPDQLSQADLAMQDSANALAAGQDAPAVAAQQRAIDALQQGEQQMSQQMASSLGISVQPGEGEGQGPGQSSGDQFGRGDEQGDGQGNGGDQDAESSQSGGDNDRDGPRDPLGRPTRDGTSGRADGGDVHVPDQMEQARTRDIQAELRRRGADRTRPAEELDYINRLLKAF
jgi:uncharacterized protein (TIGR02302 family)